MKEGWQIKAFSEISHSIDDGDWIEKKDQSETGIRLIQTGNIGVGQYRDKAEKAKFISEDTFKRLKCTEIVCGDILVSRLPDPVGRACILPSLPYKCITAVDCSIIKLKDNVIHPSWFVFYTQSQEYFAKVRKGCSGTTRDRISRKKLEVITIPVPPLSEQQRIVSLLDAEFAKIDALKANAEKNLQNAKDLFQAALKKELEPKDGWKKDLLSKVAYISRGRSQHRPRNEAILYGGDYPFIQTGDIRDANGRTITTFNQTYSEIGLQQSKLWKKGTICITIAANIGETAILGMDACFPDSVVGIIPNNQIVCTDFLNYCLIKEKDELNEIAHGTAQKNINVAILEKVLITYPIDITTQQSIVARLDVLNEKCKTLQANYEKTLSLCDDLKQALLRKAFNGEI